MQATYESLTAEYKRRLESGAPADRALYTTRIRADGADRPEREFELIGIYVRGLACRMVAIDPELDPRKAVRADGLRGVSLSNYLNHVVALARPGIPVGPGTHRWIPVRTLDPLAYGLDTRVDFERQAIVLAHDFRPVNPGRDAEHARAAAAEFALLWLEPGWALSGRVFNFDSESARLGETGFLSVQAPKAYGDASRLPWGRGLPFLALNRKFLVALKRAATREELERFLLATPERWPNGFTPDELNP